MQKTSAEKTVRALFQIAGVQINGKKPWDIQVHNPKVYARVLSGGSLALGESYVDGWWDCKALDQFFEKILSAKLEEKVIPKGIVFGVVKAKMFNMQTKKLAKRVAKQHYDVGNKLYSYMLDKNMQYTCGYWKHAKTLNKAQEDKLHLICKKLKLKPGMTVLEFGGGFGGLARFMAKHYKCKVTSYNISKEQIKYARNICKGLPVKIIESDYRDAKGTFDRVVAVGIAEHIGVKNYKTFMKVAHRCLKDKGLFLVHTIGNPVSSGTQEDPWLSKYIFPGGMIPSIKQLVNAREKLFITEDLHNFGADYDPTLMAWFKNFDKHWKDLKSDYDERFYRMWKYYLLCCAGSFRIRRVQLWQFVFSKGGIPGGYQSVR